MRHPRHTGKPHNPQHHSQTPALSAAKVEQLLHGATLPDIATADRLQKQQEAHRLIRDRAIEERREQHQQQQEEVKMSALRESLERAIADKEARAAKLQDTLNSWADDEDTPDNMPITSTTTKDSMISQERTTSVSEATFNYVRSNPYVTKQEAIAALTRLGYNPASTTSLLAHMVRQGLLSQDHIGKLTAIVKHYVPLKASPKAHAQMHAVRRKAPPQATERAAPTDDTGGIAALNSVVSLMVPPGTNVAVSITSLLDNISVNEARALYLELKKLFGGN